MITVWTDSRATHHCQPESFTNLLKCRRVMHGSYEPRYHMYVRQSLRSAYASTRNVHYTEFKRELVSQSPPSTSELETSRENWYLSRGPRKGPRHGKRHTWSSLQLPSLGTHLGPCMSFQHLTFNIMRPETKTETETKYQATIGSLES